MELLFTVFATAVVIGILVAVAPFVIIGGMFIWFGWPSIVGVIGCILLWIYVNDNLGVIFALLCFVGQYFWAKRLDDGSPGYDAMSGKNRIYDRDGKTIGYKDKE